MSQLTFDALLQLEKMDPKDVILMRHAMTEYKETSPFYLWLRYHEDGIKDFLDFQNIQERKLKLTRRYVASFTVTPQGETLFTGMYENVSEPTEVPKGFKCPVTHMTAFEDHHFYNLQPLESLQQYSGKLVIDWSGSFRNWHQNADNGSKKAILAIRDELVGRRFPGFDTFACNIQNMHLIPKSWQEVLSHSKGIYLLKCLESGKQYVGSAYGEENFWGRFNVYNKTGHGNNKEMILHSAPLGYQATVLEVCPTKFSDEQIIERENIWKEKLMTRNEIFGLNAN